MNYIVEVLLEDIKQRLFFWDVSVLTIPNSQTVIIAKKRGESASEGSEKKCFVPMFAAPSATVDASFISSIHEMCRWFEQNEDNSVEKERNTDLVLFLAFVDSSGTIAYYRCECIS